MQQDEYCDGKRSDDSSGPGCDAAIVFLLHVISNDTTAESSRGSNGRPAEFAAGRDGGQAPGGRVCQTAGVCKRSRPEGLSAWPVCGIERNVIDVRAGYRRLPNAECELHIGVQSWCSDQIMWMVDNDVVRSERKLLADDVYLDIVCVCVCTCVHNVFY